MYYKKAPRRGKFRTFAQITFAAGEEQSVAEQLKDARKAARAVAGETAKMRLCHYLTADLYPLYHQP